MSKELQILKTVSKLISYLSKLSDEQIKQIEENSADINFIFRSKIKTKGKSTDNKAGVVFNVNEIASAIKNMHDRQQVESYLDKTIPSKVELLKLAKFLDIPVSKSDKTEQIKHKLIEGTIGFKLRSHAIQNTGNLSNT